MNRIVFVLMLVFVSPFSGTAPATADGIAISSCKDPQKIHLVCSDSNACTTNDTCQGDGSCRGVPVSLDDGHFCTEDSCDSQTGVSHRWRDGCCEEDSACGDDNPCTVDACAGNACSNTQAEGCCLEDAACDDGDPCTTDTCLSNACSYATAAACIEPPPVNPPPPPETPPAGPVDLTPLPEEAPLPPEPETDDSPSPIPDEPAPVVPPLLGKAVCIPEGGSATVDVGNRQAIMAITEDGARTRINLEIIPEETDEVEASLNRPPPLMAGDTISVRQTEGRAMVRFEGAPFWGGGRFLLPDPEPRLTFQVHIPASTSSDDVETLSFLVTAYGGDGRPKWSSTARCMIAIQSFGGGGCSLIAR